MQKLPRKIELLAPAKDYETGIAAVACSKDDDDDNLPPVSSSKRLVSIAIGSDGIEDYVYEYDKNGRMISAIEIEDDGSLANGPSEIANVDMGEMKVVRNQRGPMPFDELAGGFDAVRNAEITEEEEYIDDDDMMPVSRPGDEDLPF